MKISELTEASISLSPTSTKAKAWIEKVYAKFPGTWQNNHVMTWGEGEDQQFAMFELVPSFSKKDAVEVKWFQAYPLRQGIGSKAMKVLQDLAREDGISLTLYPWDKGQVSQSKLTKFYKGHGFTPLQKGGKSMQWSPVAEAFNAPYPMTWEHGDESHDALVKLPDGTNLSVMFSLDYGDYGDEEWQVEFWRNNSQDVTGEGDAQRIFATVLSAIQEFIKTEHPERIRFSASKETDAGNRNVSRSSLYTSLVRRYARSWGYDVDVSDYAGSVVYELARLQ